MGRIRAHKALRVVSAASVLVFLGLALSSCEDLERAGDTQASAVSSPTSTALDASDASTTAGTTGESSPSTAADGGGAVPSTGSEAATSTGDGDGSDDVSSYGESSATVPADTPDPGAGKYPAITQEEVVDLVEAWGMYPSGAEIEVFDYVTFDDLAGAYVWAEHEDVYLVVFMVQSGGWMIMDHMNGPWEDMRCAWSTASTRPRSPWSGRTPRGTSPRNACA